MANRESQGLQIALILFVMVSVVLAVMTFVFYRSSSETASELEAQRQTAQTANANKRDADFKVQYLQHILGYKPLTEAELGSVLGSIGSDPDIAAIQSTFQADMANYGDGLSAEKQNYRELPIYLTNSIREKNAANADLLRQVRTLTQEKAKFEEDQLARTNQAQEGLRLAQAEIQEIQRSFSEERDGRTRDWENREKNHNKNRGDLLKQLEEEKRASGEAQTKLTSAEQTVEEQMKRIRVLVDQPFETPDGEVYYVNQRTGTVWINLGAADGLRRQTTFSVYDREAMNVATRRSDEDESGVRQADYSKGKIEITKVLDQHLAEGRIVDDEPGNPIMKGDKVFSPAWRPGRRIRFAIAGIIDLDGDRRSDMGQVKNIISMGGGELADDVDEDTRYLVLGDTPTERAAATAYSDKISKAELLGIEKIQLEVLLDLMGYKKTTRSIQLNPRRNVRQDPNAAGTDAAAETLERTPPSDF